jgi:hypothetical protein
MVYIERKHPNINLDYSPLEKEIDGVLEKIVALKAQLSLLD